MKWGIFWLIVNMFATSLNVSVGNYGVATFCAFVALMALGILLVDYSKRAA